MIPSHIAPGTRLDDRYELLYPYAQGGMATVWAARVRGKHGFEKIVAVKTILPHIAREKSFQSMFLDEARIASRIRHPNVAELDDLGEERGTLYMVLEWVDGDSWARLHHAVRKARKPFPQALLLRIAADACAGLHAAHELRGDRGELLGVVHRDVSPQNILISTSGAVKVIDFGVAKAAHRLAENTKTGFLKGKAEYVAPEQALQQAVDRRADVWAIGVMLYQYLADRLPFEAESDLATLKLIASGRPPRPLPPTIPEPIARVVLRALAPLPERWATAAELQRALEAAMPEPAGPAEIAAFVREHLADRIEARRHDLAEAIRAAHQREAAAGPAPEGVGSGRALLPSLPPEALPLDADRSGGVPALEEAEAGRGSTTGLEAPTRQRALGRITRGHVLLLLIATAITLAVWAAVLHVLLTSPRLRPTPAGAAAGLP